MDPYVTFKKIASWMLEKDGITTNDIVKMAGIPVEAYSIIMEDQEPNDLISSVRASVQAFNTKHFSDYLEAKTVEELPEQSKYDMPEEEFEKPESEPKPPKEEREVIHLDKETIKGQNDILYNQDRNDRRRRERAQEKIFYEQLQRLRDVTPEHMTFDLILKHK